MGKEKAPLDWTNLDVASKTRLKAPLVNSTKSWRIGARWYCVASGSVVQAWPRAARIKTFLLCFLHAGARCPMATRLSDRMTLEKTRVVPQRLAAAGQVGEGVGGGAIRRS